MMPRCYLGYHDKVPRITGSEPGLPALGPWPLDHRRFIVGRRGPICGTVQQQIASKLSLAAIPHLESKILLRKTLSIEHTADSQLSTVVSLFELACYGNLSQTRRRVGKPTGIQVSDH
jgi:hypothetical protein